MTCAYPIGWYLRGVPGGRPLATCSVKASQPRDEWLQESYLGASWGGGMEISVDVGSGIETPLTVARNRGAMIGQAGPAEPEVTSAAWCVRECYYFLLSLVCSVWNISDSAQGPSESGLASRESLF